MGGGREVMFLGFFYFRLFFFVFFIAFFEVLLTFFCARLFREEGRFFVELCVELGKELVLGRYFCRWIFKVSCLWSQWTRLRVLFGGAQLCIILRVFAVGSKTMKGKNQLGESVLLRFIVVVRVFRRQSEQVIGDLV